MKDERSEFDVGVGRSDPRATSELERLRATATSLGELSMGLNEMVETLSRMIAQDEDPRND
ncbi:MAG: hypothetical protein HIU57_04450 [Acidobacteria bacterium]|nr:hypothetical protein [Acidobacteriota bacterium]